MKFLMYMVKFSAFVNCGSLKKQVVSKHGIPVSHLLCLQGYFIHAAHFGLKLLSSGHQPYTSQVPLDRLSVLTQRPLMMPGRRHTTTR